jgi:hypothetical protein
MSTLEGVRENRERRLAVTVGAVVVGLALSQIHWAGLLVAGALVALPQQSLGRGVVAGLGVGVLVVALFLSRFALVGTLGPVLGMGQPTWLALGIGLGLPTFGSLVRGVV